MQTAKLNHAKKKERKVLNHFKIKNEKKEKH
jgi:hypothetical protein